MISDYAPHYFGPIKLHLKLLQLPAGQPQAFVVGVGLQEAHPWVKLSASSLV
jgi:hypothetical protein